MAYPIIATGPDVDLLHGVEVPDPYRQLEDASAAGTRAWSAAQEEVFRTARSGWAQLPSFTAALTALARTGAVGTPVLRGARWFAVHRGPDQEHAVLVTGTGEAAGADGTVRTEPTTSGDAGGEDGDGVVRTLVDPGALDPSGATTLDAWHPSWEGDRVAVQLSAGGTEESAVTVLDARTGQTVEGPIDRARYTPVAWLPGGGAYFYVRRLAPELVPADEVQFHRRVYLHRVGADPATDVEVFGAGSDKTTYFDVQLSRDGRWLTVAASLGTAPRTDVWIADLARVERTAVDGAAAGWPAGPDAPVFVPVHVGVDARTGTHVGNDGLLYLHTDLGAPRGRLCVTSPEQPEPEHWRDVVAEDPEAVLEDWAVLDGPGLVQPLLLTSSARHAVSEVTVRDLRDGAPLATVATPGPGSTGSLSVHPEGGSTAWFSHTDFATPTTVYRLDLGGVHLTALGSRTGDGGRVVVPRVHATPPGAAGVGATGSGATDSDGASPRVRSSLQSCTSADGTTVRVFVVAPAVPDAGEGPDRPRPTVLYGYGGFGIAMSPAYSAAIAAWVAAGGVWAVACLRGGGEEGEAWHRAGMREHKQRVFDDFAAAARFLVSDGWTTADQLGVFGGSNGGLLVGAALTQHPELQAAVVCSAPLLDMVRYERFGLGESWNDEFGTAADPVEFGWLHAYSPYHHVVAGTPYPAVLFTIFDGDSRVDPLHARKLAAALQAATAADPVDRPVLVRAEADVGHGARSVTRGVELAADELAFLAHQTGLVPDPATP